MGFQRPSCHANDVLLKECMTFDMYDYLTLPLIGVVLYFIKNCVTIYVIRSRHGGFIMV